MLKHIVDHCPGASESRNRYLQDRIDRTLAEFAADIAEVHLEIRTLGAGEDERTEARLTVRFSTGAEAKVNVERPVLAGALAAAFDAASVRCQVLRRGGVKAGSEERANA
jgi:hypothetical protein